MIVSLLFTLFFAASGVCLSEVVFRKKCFADRLWLGLTLGLLLFTWLPSLFAFFIGFTVTAQLLSLAAAFAADAICIFLLIRRKKKSWITLDHSLRGMPAMLIVTLPILALGVVLLNTHILYPHENGSVWVGQVTYGDLAMHLGFITSIAVQKTFPPQYSIFPGHALNYPFLCETSGASLYQLGASARQAYLITAVYAFVLVTFGVYRFMKQWLKRDRRAALATILFFFGGGFGFFYFFDLAKDGGLLQSLLGTTGQTVSQTLLDGFYQTPTNIPALGLRWVNVIVDMLIPQRATLFGWAFLFPCLSLLHGFTFEKKREDVVMLGIIAGSLPLIHTHSFLALGIISAVWCISDLIAVRFDKDRLLSWLVYAAIACVLAAPQLFFFSFRQAAESSMVRFHLNWGNTTDSYLWFYIKNMGWIFLLMPFALLILPKRDRRIYAGVLAVWLISEFLEFQPNDYDNNKLLFIWFAFTCAIDAKLLCWLYAKLHRAVRRRFPIESIRRTDRVASITMLGGFAFYFLCKLIKAEGGRIAVPCSTLLTLFVSGGFLLTLTVAAFLHTKRRLKDLLPLLPQTAFCIALFLCIAIGWLKQYTKSSIGYSVQVFYILLTLALITIVLIVLQSLEAKRSHARFAGLSVVPSLAAFLLIFTMTVSSVMTILREWKSEYQVYTASEVELSEQIKRTSEPDAVVLANNYHWNLVTPLTGRSIVTGTGTFLFYHGINTSEREEDVRQMFEEPASCADLFRKYNVGYVLITNAERSNYAIDYDYFNRYGTLLAENDAGVFYGIPKN